MSPVDNAEKLEALRRRYAAHPGRGGCGVGAVVDLAGHASHSILESALDGLGRLEHRGGAIDDTGDGAGLLLATDQEFFARFIAPGRRLPAGHRLSVGMLFLPPAEPGNVPHWQHEIDAAARRRGLLPLGWRRVPVDESALGRSARAARREPWQLLLGEGMVPRSDVGRVLFELKHHIERWLRDLYVVSLSPDTIVYKALCTGPQLARYYLDLVDPELRSRLCVFHRRYSTNTFSNWYLAQCFRTLCHNGEINTIKANRDAVHNLEGEVGRNDVLMPQGSDSADLDRLVELFTIDGVPLPETLTRLMPPAWADLDRPTPALVRFFQGVQRALGSVGSWEGPAAVVAADGNYVVAQLDRMGLRPLRWCTTTGGRVLIASELGALPVAADEIATSGQLDPGEALAVDLQRNELLLPRQLLDAVVARSPINFAELAEGRLIPLPPRVAQDVPAKKPDRRWLNLFGWTQERVRTAKFMAENGKEPITSMGFDRPLAVFSPARPPLAKYFKQIVAVVTNPPIDPLREGSAFDLTVYLGRNPSVHERTPSWDPAVQYKLPSPFLVEEQLRRMRDALPGSQVPQSLLLDATFVDAGVSKSIAERIGELVREALAAVRSESAAILIVSDRAVLHSPTPRLPLPVLLCASAIHNALSEAGLRRRASIVVDSGDIQEGHDAALLIGSGVDAVCAHLLLALAEGSASGERQLVEALDSTLRRVMSKMGITTLDGYRGSRLFEAVGVSPELVEHYLPGVQSHIGGIDLDDIYEDLVARAKAGGSPHSESEVNMYRKEVWQELQETARGNDGAYARFTKLVADTPPVYLRDLLRWKPTEARPLDQVIPAEQIIARCFRAAAMSHGALHRTAHRAIAGAFNFFGASSNCGEGGEDSRRDIGAEWEADRSRIRQVGSARFGVDARYLVHADEIQIKIGQGAKPGEGGMLPAAKVTDEIARIRKTQVGVTLISPPPHHDLYSIEDLAQLIYNFKQVHPGARVSVKVPAVTDIGTIAVGIAKAGADAIDVSGFEGGTGAAASSSIEHAGLPLERALSETHQALTLNGVRDRVRVRADGGIKTGKDIAAVLALGADEVSLGTALMIAEQCIFCHGCSKGNCPAGITTQSDLTARRLMTIKKGRATDEALPDLEELRYQDARSGVERYLLALAEDLRRILAQLGLSEPRQLVGRVDLLEQRSSAEGSEARGRIDKVDLSELLIPVGEAAGETVLRHHRLPVDPTSSANAQLLEAAEKFASSPEQPIDLSVTTGDRAVAATLAGRRARLGMTTESPVHIRLRGFCGQGLGFALVDGIHLKLDGWANDSVGCAMSGGVLAIAPPSARGVSGGHAAASVIGNAACYGATGGKLFVEGRAGQRLGVRNSGAIMVTEGAGKYAFEYMTGGVGVVLGPVGPVVGSGMTGGRVWLYLGDGHFASERDALENRLHAGSVELRAASEEDLAELKALVTEHAHETGSAKAQALLADWSAAARQFALVVPVQEKATVLAPPPVAVAQGNTPVATG